MLTNHHTHTLFSDGAMEVEEYVKQAVKQQFSLLGFTEHSPLPFDNSFSFKSERKDEYLAIFQQLKTSYSGQIELYLGMEMDYIPGMSDDFAAIRHAYKLDYLIGSVHLVKSPNSDELWFTDGPRYETYDQGVNALFDGNIRAAVTAYYRQICEMIDTQHFEIVGHVDKVRMHNRDRFFKEDEKWYKSLVYETLELIQDKDLIVEVNTRGIYKQRSNTTFPSLHVLKLVREMRIPVMVNSDAHHPLELDAAYAEGYAALKQVGIGETVYFNGLGWAFIPIP